MTLKHLTTHERQIVLELILDGLEGDTACEYCDKLTAWIAGSLDAEKMVQRLERGGFTIIAEE